MRQILESIAFTRRIKDFGTLILSTMLLPGCSVPEASSLNSAKQETEKSYIQDPTIAALLKDFDKSDYSLKKQKLINFRSHHKALDSVHKKSAYILARLLKKSSSMADLKAAIPLFQEAESLKPLFIRSQWQISECANKTGDENLLRSCLNKIIAASRDPQTKAQASYNLAQSYIRSNEPEKAKDLFSKIIKNFPESQFALGSIYYLGQLAFLENDRETALKLWRDYLAKSPDGRFAYDIVNSLKKDFAENIQNNEDRLLFAEVYFRHGQWANALSAWKEAGDDNSNWYKKGLCLLHTGKASQGKDYLLESMKTHSKDREITDAAKLLAHRGSRAEAISVWQTVLSCSPDFGDYALYNLAIRAQDSSESLSYFSRLLKDYPESEFAAETSWWIIWNRIKQGEESSVLADLKTAAGKFENARSGPRFSYWLGKIEEKLKHPEQAKKAYENTLAKFASHYYGYRARQRLNSIAGKADQGWQLRTQKHLQIYKKQEKSWDWPEPPQLVSFDEIAKKSDSTVAMLAELHQWDECLDLLPEDQLPELRSLCLAKMSLVLDSINVIAKDLRGKPDGQAKWKLSYPLLHAKIIEKEAQAKSVDPLLAQALIREESRYNVQALSSSNAIGLMQLLPSTAMGVAKRLGVPIKSKADIHKPENNLKLGVDYLSYTLSRFKGNAMLAVASYNGGPNAVASWTRRFSISDPDTFVENIPYSETREYVRKVFGSYWNYSSIYN